MSDTKQGFSEGAIEGGTVDTEAESGEPINLQLRTHQATVEDWDFATLIKDLHLWAERMRLEFKLQTPVPALMVERLRTRLGHYRIGRNALGLNDEIAIDRHHATGNKYWQVLGTLLHEMLHAWQEHKGHPAGPNSHNYHNKEFREKAQSLGLIIDRYGHTEYPDGDTPFRQLLKKYGVEAPEVLKSEPPPRPRCGSRLKLYECPCHVKARVGRSRFNARCLDCGGLFERMA